MRLSTLGILHVSPAAVWNAKLDQLRHLPSRYLNTRYPIEMAKALETERGLCRSFIRRGADPSTKYVAMRWVHEINRDLPKLRGQAESG